MFGLAIFRFNRELNEREEIEHCDATLLWRCTVCCLSTIAMTARRNRVALGNQEQPAGLLTHPVKIDLNKKLEPKQKTIQAFNIDA